jgi:hypothetical protein
LGVALILGILLGACGSSGAEEIAMPQPESVGAAQATVESADLAAAPDMPELDALLDAPADPLSLGIAVDESLAVSSVLSYEGGTLTATGADETTYTLEIPEGALYAPTQIRMTPVASVGGLPFGEGVTYAVQLEPDGLHLSDVAILTITPPDAIPVEEQVFFGYRGEDNEFAFALPVADSSALQIMITHFSGYGVDKGLLADTEPIRRRLGGDIEDRLDALAAEHFMRERQIQLLGAGDADDDPDDLGRFFAWYVATYVREVIRPRMAAAGESCAAGRLAIQTVLGFARRLMLLGYEDAQVDAILGDIPRAMARVSEVCLQEEYELCRDEHIVHRIVPAVLGTMRQRQLLGIDDSSAQADAFDAMAWDLVRKCLTFELELESTAQTVTPGIDATAESVVEATVPLHFILGMPGTIEGESALINRSFSIESPNCSLNASRGGSTLRVANLGWEVDVRDSQDEVGYVRDITLTLAPDPTTEAWTGTCTVEGVTLPYNAESANVWSSTWGAVRAEACMADAGGEAGGDGQPPIPDLSGLMETLGQIDPNSGLTPEQMQLAQGAVAGQAGNAGLSPEAISGCTSEVGWDVQGGDVFATKEWSLTSSMGVSMSEEGSMILRHTPQ